MKEIQQNTSSSPLLFLMVQSTDHVSPATGLTPVVTLSKNGGSFASPSGAVTEVGSGWYKVAGNATDTNTVGPLILHATGTGADPTDTMYKIVPWNPLDGTNLGLASLPAVAYTAPGGLITSGTGNYQLNPTGGNIGLVSGDSPVITAGTASAGTATTVTLATSPTVGTTLATTDAYKGCIIYITGGTGAGQAPRVISAYNSTTKVATVTTAFAITPDATSAYQILKTRVPSLDANLQVTSANVTGDVQGKVLGGGGSTITGAGTQIDLTQSVPTSNTAQTVGDAFNAARAQGFGKWALSGTTLTLYAGDGATVVRTFTLDSATAPTTRS